MLHVRKKLQRPYLALRTLHEVGTFAMTASWWLRAMIQVSFRYVWLSNISQIQVAYPDAQLYT
jgi:hypothetical protein